MGNALYAERQGATMTDADHLPGAPIRVVIVDDHALFRHGLRELLVEQGFEVVGEASNGETALALAAQHSPDVLVMDLNMPGIGGVEATRRITDEIPASRVLVLTITSGQDEVNNAILAGAAGYLLKDASPEEIGAGVRAVAAGEALVSPRIAAGLLERIRTGGRDGPPRERLALLTDRELDVLRLLGHGESNSDIAAELHITAATAKNHVASILKKLGFENRIEAAVYAARTGLI
jgi:DNA-binding NarL/FixJ family response regulator